MTKKRVPGWHDLDSLVPDIGLSPTLGVADHAALPQRLGRYELLEQIGRGGVGTVFRAHDTNVPREVAVKVVRTGFDPARMARFDREVRALALLSHPNIVAMYDAGMEGDLAYFAMELVAGQTLREQLNKPGVSIEQALQIALQIARGLAAAHARGIVHRDLKPENVFVGTDALVKVLDFGLARFGRRSRDALAGVESHETRTGVVLGTVDYMSPEQARGQRASVRSDVFSFGAVLYELVTGRKAFRADSQVEVLTRILSDAPKELEQPSISTLRGRLLHVAKRCLQKDRKLRYASGAELVAALAEAEVVPARSSRPPRRTRVSVQPFEQPVTRYARDGDVHVAYQVIGNGPIDLCFVAGFVSQLDVWWEAEPGRRFFQGLAAHSRLVLFDKRGTGLSDRVIAPTLDQRVSDVQVVLDAIGSKRVVLFGEGAATCISWALRYPERTHGLILYGTTLRSDWTGKDAVRELITKGWGTGVSLPLFAPSLCADPQLATWGARWERLGASPGAVLTLLDSIDDLDVRAEARRVRCPTLVLHRRGDRAVPVERGREVADMIPGARYVEHEGEDHAPMVGDGDRIVQEVLGFLRELLAARTPQRTS